MIGLPIDRSNTSSENPLVLEYARRGFRFLVINKMKNRTAIFFTTIFLLAALQSPVFSQNRGNDRNEYSSKRQERTDKIFTKSNLQDSPLSPVGDWFWGNCWTVDARDSFAFIGNGLYFHVLNNARPDSPNIVGEYLCPLFVNDLAVRDTFAFIACGNLLLILNIKNPFAPVKCIIRPKVAT